MIEVEIEFFFRGMMDEKGEQFVTYYLPTKETLEARARDAQNEKPFEPDYTYYLIVKKNRFQNKFFDIGVFLDMSTIQCVTTIG